MERLNRNDEEYQYIDITSTDIIKDFLETFFPIWEEDILNFENLKKNLKIENIKILSIWSYVGLQEEINHNLTLNDNTKRSYYIPRKKLLSWLEKHDFVM